MTLQAKLLNPQQFIALYGTTAPRADLPPERVVKAADKLSERIRNLPLDGLVVYDVQDEPGRSTEPRPFPFLPTLDSRVYAQMLHERTAQPVITYKSISGMASDAWEPWLTETKEEYGINFLSLVGVSASSLEGNGISLSQATQVAASHPANFTLGGVVIAERHSKNAPKAHASSIRHATAVASLSPKPSMMPGRRSNCSMTTTTLSTRRHSTHAHHLDLYSLWTCQDPGIYALVRGRHC